ncbi:hypothetical protein [Sphingomonas rosea]
MAWDLRGAFLKKGERESARLADFEFRLRVRTLRLFARELGLDEDETVALVARGDDDAALAALGSGVDLRERFAHCRDRARRELIAERGNPAPHRLL